MRSREVYIGFRSKHVAMLRARATEFNTQLRSLQSERAIEVIDFKANNLLTPKEALAYGNAAHVY